MQVHCEKCQKTMDESQFYTYKDGSKTELCKKCLTMHVDNFDSKTFLWILEKMDVPYIEEEWNTLRDRAYAKNPNTVGGMSVFGKYLSKMKLKQWKNYCWADTEKLKAEKDQAKKEKEEQVKEFEKEMRGKLERGEITASEYKTMTSPMEQMEAKSLLAATDAAAPLEQNNPFAGTPFVTEDGLIDTANNLTEEDKLYLAMKWGRLYQPHEWVELERIYTEMTHSFDIQDADTTNTLILICKTNLKMNQAIDVGDLDGFQKLSRVSESLRKSAKFTAAQNKEEKNDYVDSVGELVAMCEKEGFIPRFPTDIPQDKIDLTLRDMNSYVHKLVTQDLGFGQQIEDALKKIQIQKELNEQEEQSLETGETPELTDEDYEEFYNSLEEQKQKDKMIGEDK